MSGLSIPLQILVPKAEYHRCSSLSAFSGDSQVARGTVSIIHDDGTAKSWIGHIARSKFVVLPISANSIAPSGISTYLSAMALGKCVIITRSPATEGILDESNCVIVPPADPVALRNAIQKVDSDARLRSRIAQAGYRYAMGLGDTRRLHWDFVEYIVQAASGGGT